MWEISIFTFIMIMLGSLWSITLLYSFRQGVFNVGRTCICHTQKVRFLPCPNNMSSSLISPVIQLVFLAFFNIGEGDKEFRLYTDRNMMIERNILKWMYQNYNILILLDLKVLMDCMYVFLSNFFFWQF